MTSLHNFELNQASQRWVAEHYSEENRLAQVDEQGSSIHFIGGDFNFLVRGDSPARISLNDSEIPLKENDARVTTQANDKLRSLLTNAPEHHQVNLTRIGHNPNANENPETQNLIAKRIARLYSSILPWQAMNLKIKTHNTVDVTKAETNLWKRSLPDCHQDRPGKTNSNISTNDPTLACQTPLVRKIHQK